MFIGAIVTLSLALACGAATPKPTPTPLPTPQAVEQLYQFFMSEKTSNPSRLEKRVDNGGIFGFTGNISKIEGSKIQFHISEQSVGKDKYVECDLGDIDRVLSLNTGMPVTVYGRLDKAFPSGILRNYGFKDSRAVKFKGCKFY